MFGKKRNVVMVDKDVYEAMTGAFRKVKAERERNKQLADKLKKDLILLDRELIKMGAKITEFMASINALEESVGHLDDYSAKNKLSKEIGYVLYMMDGMEDKKHRLKDIMDAIKRDVKPFEDIYLLKGEYEINF